MWKEYSFTDFDLEALPWRRPAEEELDQGEVLGLHGVKFTDVDIEAAGFDPADGDLSFAFLSEPFRKHEAGCRVIFGDDSDRIAIEVEPYPIAWFLLNADKLKPARLALVAETLRELLADQERRRAHAREVGQMGGRPRTKKPSKQALYRRELRARAKRQTKS